MPVLRCFVQEACGSESQLVEIEDVDEDDDEMFSRVVVGMDVTVFGAVVVVVVVTLMSGPMVDMRGWWR